MRTSKINVNIRLRMKILWFCSILVMTTGCSSNFKLIAFGGDTEHWEVSVKPRMPQGPEEEAVYEAARWKEVKTHGDFTAIFLAGDESTQIVVAIEGSRLSVDEMAPKKITYYLVVNRIIRAHSEPIMAPSPDIDYERTIYAAAARAKYEYGINVTIYSRPMQNLTVKAVAKTAYTNCTFEVTVLNGFDVQGEILSLRDVKVCSDDRFVAWK